MRSREKDCRSLRPLAQGWDASLSMTLLTDLVAGVLLPFDRTFATDPLFNRRPPKVKLHLCIPAEIADPVFEDHGKRERGSHEDRKPEKGSNESHWGKKKI
jgi:hypothetical protein